MNFESLWILKIANKKSRCLPNGRDKERDYKKKIKSQILEISESLSYRINKDLIKKLFVPPTSLLPFLLGSPSCTGQRLPSPEATDPRVPQRWLKPAAASCSSASSAPPAYTDASAAPLPPGSGRRHEPLPPPSPLHSCAGARRHYCHSPLCASPLRPCAVRCCLL